MGSKCMAFTKQRKSVILFLFFAQHEYEQEVASVADKCLMAAGILSPTEITFSHPFLQSKSSLKKEKKTFRKYQKY